MAWPDELPTMPIVPQRLDSHTANAHALSMLRVADRIDIQGPPPTLADRFGRRFAYLRLSVTDRCNFRCAYCLPNGYRKAVNAPPELTVPEIARLVRAFAAMGVTKIRLTGGEPSVRRDLVEIAAVVKQAGVATVAMTTNGYRLARDAAALADAGVGSVNVSVDSLDRATFHRLTGHDRLADVLAGVEAARDAGMTVKLNAVLMRGINDDDLERWITFVHHTGLTVRFIETMQTGDNGAFFAERHRPGAFLATELDRRGWLLQPRASTDGPAVTYRPPDGSRGGIGLILPYGPDFCASCNRLRVSAAGRLHLCLFGEGGHDLRDLAQSSSQQAALMDRIASLLPLKVDSHRLVDGDSGATRHFASIGG
jgi:cyclic pyranopterin phosphate synthase